jgi:hypothetical protein
MTQGALVGLALLGGACQGELKLLNTNNGGVTPTVDMAMEETPVEDVISFLQVNKDMDQPALGCTSPIGACHGGAMPVGVLKLALNGPKDMGNLMLNYEQSKARVDLAVPANSTLLTKPLATKPEVMHTGGKTYFKNEMDTFYVRWLNWVRCGAKLEEVKLSTCPGGT